MAPAPAWLRGVLAATCLKELEAHTDAAARAYYNHIDSRDHASSAARLPRAQLLAAAVRILRLAAAAQRLPHSCAKCALCVLGMVFEGPQDCKTALPLSDSGDLLGLFEAAAAVAPVLAAQIEMSAKLLGTQEHCLLPGRQGATAACEDELKRLLSLADMLLLHVAQIGSSEVPVARPALQPALNAGAPTSFMLVSVELADAALRGLVLVLSRASFAEHAERRDIVHWLVTTLQHHTCCAAVLRTCGERMRACITPTLVQHMLRYIQRTLALQLAVLHHACGGRSSVPADAAAAAVGVSARTAGGSSGGGSGSGGTAGAATGTRAGGGSGGGGSGGGGGGGGAQGPSHTLLAVPAHHAAVLRSVPGSAQLLRMPGMHESLGGATCPGATGGVVQVLADALEPGGCTQASDVMPLLQLLVEAALLAADNAPALATIVAALDSGVRLLRWAEAGADADAALTAASQAALLLQPVLHQVSAAVLHSLQQQPCTGSGYSPEDWSCAITFLPAVYARLLASVAQPVKARHLAMAIAKQPLRSLAALEMSVRVLANDAVSADAAAGWAAAAVAACTVAVQDVAQFEALLECGTEEAALADSHLLSTLLSCLKACKGCMARHAHEAASDDEQHKFCMLAAHVRAVATAAMRRSAAGASSCRAARPGWGEWAALSLRAWVAPKLSAGCTGEHSLGDADTQHVSDALFAHAMGAVAAAPLGRWGCSNPACANVSGLCEMHLVAGRGLCGHCGGAARYCSKACQAQHWRAHRDSAAASAARQARP